MANLRTRSSFPSPHARSSMENDDNEDNCPICMSPYTDPIPTPCEHMFCRECIDQWSREKDTCPVCRRALSTNEAAAPPTPASVFTNPVVQSVPPNIISPPTTTADLLDPHIAFAQAWNAIPLGHEPDIPHDFEAPLAFPIFDRGLVHVARMEFDDIITRTGDELAVRSRQTVRVWYSACQSTMLGAGLWFWNRIDADFPPHMRQRFRDDWVTVFDALNRELWKVRDREGTAVDLHAALMGFVCPSRDEPLRSPLSGGSWDGFEQMDRWWRANEYGTELWKRDGWELHVERLKFVVRYVVHTMVRKAREGLEW